MSDNQWTPKGYKDYKWIVQDSELLEGQFSIRGTRLPVSLILGCLAAGWSIQDITEEYEGWPVQSLSEIYSLAAELAAGCSSGKDAA